MGITTNKKEDASLTDFIRRADEALYKAKHKGRNRLEIV
jgi:PleD family two-component response regulator